ncbi:MAG: hypothetical protein LBP62_05230 [Clostridiales bacterium]|jgi:hypothetical protein|nr:hypothetical protein [Clostridiales bacterium]
MLKQNRLFGLFFRTVSFALCLAGLVSICFRGGTFSPFLLLYYTTQSNILVLVYFAVVIIKTAIDIKKYGKTGSSSYFERLSAAFMIAISVTMLVFWTLLVPSAFVMRDGSGDLTAGAPSLFSFSNLQVHLITPLLMIADYIMFSARGKLKKNDPFLFTLIPIAYLIQTTIIGFTSGITYGVDPITNKVLHFPYFFIDYYISGPMVAVYVAVIAAFFVGVSYGILYLDRKYAKKI